MGDIGGQDRIRKLWRYYYAGTHGVIFVIDSSDRDRIQDAREELWSLLMENDMRDVVLLVLPNKQDLPNAMTPGEISKYLGLAEIRNRHWFIQPTRATTGQGIYEGLEWFSKTLATAR